MSANRRIRYLGALVALLLAGLFLWTANPALAQAPDPAVQGQITDSGPFTAGASGTYTINVTNLGDAVAPAGVIVDITVSAGLTIVGVSGGSWTCSNTANSGQCTSTVDIPASGGTAPITVNVNISSSTPPQVSLNATISAGGGSNPANDTGSKTTDVNGTPDLTITKFLDPTTPEIVNGNPARFIIRVQNIGSTITTAPVTVNDLAGTGSGGGNPVTITGASGTGWTCNPPTGISVGCVYNAQVGTGQFTPDLIIDVVGNNPTTSTITITGNTATVTGLGDTNPANNSSTPGGLVYGSPNLAIVKAAGPNFIVGVNNSYTITINNVGAQTLRNIVVTDTLPAGIGFISGSGSSFTCNAAGQVVTCTRTATLGAGGNAVITLNVSVSQHGTLNNVVNVTTQYDTDTSNNNYNLPTTVRAVDFAISKTRTGEIAIGTNAEYTLTITNVGNTTFPADGSGGPYGAPNQATITVTDNLPPQLRFFNNPAPVISGAGGFNCTFPPDPPAPQNIVCTSTTTMNPGDVATIRFNVRPIDSTIIGATNISNTATVATSFDQNASNNSSTETFPGPVATPDLVLSATASQTPDPFVAGQLGTFTFTLDNNSPSIAEATGNPIVVTIRIPTGATFNAASATGGSAPFTCAPPTGAGDVICTATTGFIRQGSPATFSVSFFAPITQSALNVPVQVVGGNDPFPANPAVLADSRTYSLNNTAPDLTINKSHTADFVRGSSSAVYSFTVTNNGNGPTAAPTTVTDILPLGMFFISDDSADWACSHVINPGTGRDEVTCTFSNPILPGAANATSFNITVYVDPVTALGTNINTATVTTVTDANNSNNSDSDPTNVLPQPLPDLTVTQNCTPQSVAPTQVVTCTMSITNIGPVASSASDEVVLTFTAGRPDPATINGPAGWFQSFTPTGAVWARTGSINPSQTITGFEYAMTIDAAATPGTFNNTVTVSLNPGTTLPDGNPANNTTTAPTITITAAPTPDLGVSIAPATLNAVAGTNVQYTVTVTNTSTVTFPGGPSAVQMITNFTAPISATAASGTGWTCTPNPPNFTCTRSDSLAVGASYPDIIIDATIAAAATPGTYPVGASITITPAGNDSNATNNNATNQTTVTAAPQPDLRVVSESHVNPFTINQPGTFSITIRNDGTGATTQPVRVLKTLPSGFSVVAGNSGSQFNCVAGTGADTGRAVCTRSTPIPANSGDLLITLQLTPSAAGTFPNTSVTVEVTAPDVDSNLSNNTFTDPTNIIVGGVPNLTVSKTEQPAGNFLLTNGTGTYRITITNNGSGPTSGTITVTDTLPAIMNFNAASSPQATLNCSGTSTVTCTTNYVLPAGQSFFIDLVVNLTGTGTVTNNVSVTGGGFSGTATGSDTTTVDAAPTPDLTITKASVGTYQVNTQGTFTLTVNNVGTAATTADITVTDTLDSKFAFVSGSGGGFSCSAAGQLVTCTSSTPIAVGGNAQITLTVNAIGVGPASNQAQVSGGGETNTTNNLSNVVNVNILAGPPDLSITKSVSGTLTADVNGIFNLAIANSATGGPTTGTITVTDTLQTGLQFVTGGGGSFSCSAAGQAVTCTRTAAMNTGEVANIALTVLPLGSVFQGTTPIPITNTATVSTTGDTNPANNSSTINTTVTPANPNAPGSFTFSLSPASSVSVNAQVTLTITITRVNGTPAASDTTVTLAPSSSNGLTVTPGLSQVTNTSGQVTFTLTSSVAQTITFGITASNSAGSKTFTTGLPAVTWTGGAGTGTVSAANSTVTTDYTSIPADGTTRATITVTLRDSANNPVSGKPVSLAANPASTTIRIEPATPGVTTSDANGVVRFYVSATAQNPATTFTASVTDITIIFLNQTVTITFTAPGTAPVPAATTTGTPGTLTPTDPRLLVVPTGPITGEVVAWRLRVRTGPGLEYPIIGLLRYRTLVSIIGRNQRGTWFLIELQTGSAWVSAAWIRIRRSQYRLIPIVAAAPGTAGVVPVPFPLIPVEGQAIGVVNTYRLRVRTGPGLFYPRIGVITEGTEILLLGISPDRAWYKFKTMDGEAWCSAFYVRIKLRVGNRLPVVEPPPTP